MKIRTMFTKLGNALDAILLFTKRTFVFIIFIALAAAIIGGLSSQKIEIPEEAILIHDLKGPLVEELTILCDSDVSPKPARIRFAEEM